MKIDLKNKYHIAMILIVSVVCFMSAMVVLSPYTRGPQDKDADKDTIADAQDNCPNVPNSDQSDVDDDGTGDVCDTCTDTDGDGYGNPGYPRNTCREDNCPDTENANQTDRDQDRVGDACDTCPQDPLNDADNDGICGGVDNCPSEYNPAQSDADADGTGDACELPPQAQFTYVPSEPIRGEIIQFTDTTTAGGGMLQQWQWIFGDNTSSSEQHPTHQYMSIGVYTVQLTVTDINGKVNNISKQLTIIRNDPPEIPTIIGPTIGITGEQYRYNLKATDPDGNLLFYTIDWGDHTRTEDLGPYASGQEISINHSWSIPGRYMVQVQTEDTHHTQSPTTVLLVRIPQLPLLNPLFIDFFKQVHQLPFIRPFYP